MDYIFDLLPREEVSSFEKTIEKDESLALRIEGLTIFIIQKQLNRKEVLELLEEIDNMKASLIKQLIGI